VNANGSFSIASQLPHGGDTAIVRDATDIQNRIKFLHALAGTKRHVTSPKCLPNSDQAIRQIQKSSGRVNTQKTSAHTLMLPIVAEKTRLRRQICCEATSVRPSTGNRR